MCVEIYTCGCILIYTRMCVQYTNMFIHTHRQGPQLRCDEPYPPSESKKIHTQEPIKYMPSPMRQPVIQSARERKNMLADVFRHITTYSQLVLVWWVLQALDMLHNATCSHHPQLNTVVIMNHCKNFTTLCVNEQQQPKRQSP